MTPPTSVIVSPEPFDAAEEAGALGAAARGAGAIVTFTGRVRGDAVSGEAVTGLELIAHPTFTRAEIARLAEEAAQGFSVAALRVRHRCGLMRPGDAIVFVGAAARHRRAAFEAVDALMNALKTRAPFWKKEHGPHGVRWIEPTAADYAADRSAAHEDAR